MSNKKLEKMKIKAGVTIDKDTYTKMSEAESRLICKMREIIYDQANSIFKEPTLTNSNTTAKERINMVVKNSITGISKQLHIPPNQVLMFLLFDKITYELELERNIRKNLANDKDYQKIIEEIAKRENKK